MILRLLLISSFVLLSDTAWSKDQIVETEIEGHVFKKKCHAGDPKKCTMYVPANAPAPYSGILYTPRLAATQAVRAAGCKDEIDLAVKREQDVAATKKRGDDRLHKIDLGTKDKEIKILEDALEDAGPSWYSHPAFVIPVTVAATLGAVAATVAIADRLRGTKDAQ
jgi:hypothetical protein